MLNWKMGSIYVIGTRGFVGMRALMSKILVNWGARCSLPLASLCLNVKSRCTKAPRVEL